MKRGIGLASLFMIIIFMSLALALNDPSQIIIKLSNESNAHAEVWNSSGFSSPHVVYFDNKFTNSYLDPNPQSCTATNLLVNISSITNAHAEIPPSANYKVKVCYGDLVCTVRNGACNLNQNESTILSLSSTTDAHLAKSARYAGLRLCCSSVKGGAPKDDDLGTSDNKPPIARIGGPIDRAIYCTNTTIQFNHTSTDPESGPLTVFWDINDTLSNPNQNAFTHKFMTPGEKIITLTVSDAGSASDSDQKAILIANCNPGISYSALAFIEKPAHEEIVSNPSLIVDHSANKSYAIRVNVTGSSPNCQLEVACIAGECPAKTQNSPSCSANSSIQVNVLSTPKTNANSIFNWSFDDGTILLGLGKSTGQHQYSSAGQKSIVLTYNFSNPQTNLQEKFARIFTLSTISQCIEGKTIFVEPQTGLRRNTLTSSACGGSDGNINTLGDNCCPPGLFCTSTGCKPGQPSVYFCEDYTTQSDCNSDPFHVPLQDYALWDVYKCGQTVNGVATQCKCTWDSGSCKFSKLGYNPIISPPNSTNKVYECKLTHTVSECQDGLQDIVVKATLIPASGTDPTCKDQTLTGIPCGAPTLELPFFGAAQFAITISLIISLYICLHLLRRR